jgi:hypothetical protein
MLIRVVIAGFAGGIAWIAGLIALFGPAQSILGDPAYQSAKFLTVMNTVEPLPRIQSSQWILAVGLIGIGIIHSAVYHGIRRAFGGHAAWKRGIEFGIVSWAIMVPWFEFYLPWNVMREPLPLVMLEVVLWLGVMLLVGLAIAAVHEWRRGDAVS